MSLEVLTLGSLDKLTEYCRTNPTSTKIIHQFEEINSELELTYAPVDYGFTEESFRPLAMPVSSNDTLENDKKNVPILFNALKEMSAAHATDERLWATLAIKHFSNYCHARWPVPKKEDKYGSHITSHWLCQSGTRSRIRDNAISRLWWMGYMIDQLDDWQQKDVIKVLFNNSDYRAQIIERSSSSSAPNVMGTILTITAEASKKKLEFRRDAFRDFMKQVNFYATRTNLATLSRDQLYTIFNPLYYQSYK